MIKFIFNKSFSFHLKSVYTFLCTVILIFCYFIHDYFVLHKCLLTQVKKHGKQDAVAEFRSQLDALGLKINQVTADGNCFFRFVENFVSFLSFSLSDTKGFLLCIN